MTVIEELRIPAAPERLWQLLVEEGGAAAILPGLRGGTPGRGTLRATVGGHAVTYRGYGRQHVDEPGRRVTWTLSGREVRGEGRAHVEVRARFKAAPEGACDLRLTVLVDGRGRLDEAGEEARGRAVGQGIARFRRALERRLEEEGIEARVAVSPPPAPGGARPQLEIMPPAPTRLTPRITAVAVALGAATVAAGVFVVWRYLRRR